MVPPPPLPLPLPLPLEEAGDPPPESPEEAVDPEEPQAAAKTSNDEIKS
jgi:hypothetical protein